MYIGNYNIKLTVVQHNKALSFAGGQVEVTVVGAWKPVYLAVLVGVTSHINDTLPCEPTMVVLINPGVCIVS